MGQAQLGVKDTEKKDAAVASQSTRQDRRANRPFRYRAAVHH